jgi:protoheme IX farnesyltransferase
MKAIAQTVPATAVAASEKSWPAVYADLVKARLTLLVLLTTVVGFYVGARGPLDVALLFHTLVGTALVACGAAALNEFLEREHDARMRRTQDRPLPSGRMQPVTALGFGTICAVGGVAWQALAVNATTAALGAVSLVSYLFIYTPLKRVSWTNTLVGASPGGLPPLMGWAAARGGLSAEGWTLFAIQALWQLPHFMAIAWLYRDEYARAGFVMLPRLDPDGRRTAQVSVGASVALLVVSAGPFWLGLAGGFYLAGALASGLLFAWLAVQFSRDLTASRARQLFYASLLYLPLVMGFLVLDKQ